MPDDERDEGAVARFVERFSSGLVEAGMPRMPARVFAALLACDSGALTSAELGEQLQVSPAAVSGAVRYLAQLGLVAREREPGSRRELYAVHGDTWYETFSRRDQMLSRWEDTLAFGVEAVGASSSAGRRLGETAEFFAFLKEESAALMERWRARREEREEHEGPA